MKDEDECSVDDEDKDELDVQTAMQEVRRLYQQKVTSLTPTPHKTLTTARFIILWKFPVYIYVHRPYTEKWLGIMK